MKTLHFNRFGQAWEEGIPIGNGRIAAMLWETPTEHVISLNHEWIWSGNFKERECDESAHFLPYVRDYLKKGENFKATALAALAFGGTGGISPLLRRMDSFQPAVDLVLTHPETNTIRRTLEMDGGVAGCETSNDRETFSLQAFCHGEKDLFAARWTSSVPATLAISLSREEDDTVTCTRNFLKDGLSFACDGGNGVAFRVVAHWETDGTAKVKQDRVVLENATFVTIWANIGTQHKGIEEELARTPLAGDFHQLLTSQRELFAREMAKVTLEFWDENTSELEALSIEERKERMAQGHPDAELVSMYANFGVYLMIAGSLLAELPLNLQGKWNHEIIPKWNSDYHLNINLQMNYWFADRLNMDRYTKQMTDYVLRILPKAREAAKRLYGCRGVWYPLSSDIWANATPESYNYAVWIGAAGWLAAHFWNNWLHTGDEAYLRDYAYPFFKEVARFYEDYIVIDETGTAQLMPSQSPENKYAGCGYFPVGMCISSAMDVQIAYDALTFASQAARHLQIDEEDAACWESLRDRLPPFRIGKDGRLLEWDTDDKQETEEGHRHVSHLYGVYPSNLFTPEKRVPQFKAAYQSLDYRLKHSGGHTGWSSAWSACLFARFLQGDKVMENLKRLIVQQSSSTLLDFHPDHSPASRKSSKKPSDTPSQFLAPVENPGMIFQIDGNMGATAAVIEALIQYRDGVVHLLPAVSGELSCGKVAGIRVQGGHIFAFRFKDGVVTDCTVTLGFAGEVRIAGFGPDGGVLTLHGEPGAKFTVCGNR